MQLSKRGNLVVEKRAFGARGVSIVRFARPDLRAELYDDADIAVCPLYQELQEAVLADAADGEALVFNLAIIEIFNTAFYRLLRKAREMIVARNGHVVLCRASSIVDEVLVLFNAAREFDIVKTEKQAAELYKE
jgi:anti-anti-sigma regulatory factor